MPSPFPGMDPYLEDPAIWPDVHSTLMTAIRDALVPHVRPKYAVRLEQRVYVSDGDDTAYRTIVPDIHIVRNRTARPAPAVGKNAVTTPIDIALAEPIETRELRVEIIDRAAKSVVTVIELLSPANKVTGSQARRSFVEKRRDVLAAGAHWMEFDLLRSGTRGVDAVEVPESDYLIYLNRKEANGRRGLGWPFQLRDAMPTVAVPLRAPDADVPLDLQALLTGAYNRAGYDGDIDYTKDPVVALRRADRAWARKIINSRSA